MYCAVDWKKLQLLGKGYPWKRPRCCPKCKSKRLWGHGYVIRYFQEFNEGIYLKRWYCVDCTSIHITRPETHQARMQYPKQLIRKLMNHKASTGTFSQKHVCRQVQQYWWRNLQRWFISISLTYTPADVVDHITQALHLRVGASLFDRVVSYATNLPYLPFALSTKPHPG